MGKYCFGHLLRHSFGSLRFFSNTTTATTISNSREEFTDLCLRGHVKEAFNRFKSDIWSDPTLFSHLIKSCMLKKSLPLAKQLHSLIITYGCSSDKFTCNHLLNMYIKLGQLQTAVALFGSMPRKNIMSCNILINGYMQSGDLESARKVFNFMPERNIATWNAMVAGLIQYEFNEEGLRLLSEMHQLGFFPDEFTLGSVLRGCAGLRGLREGRQVHGYVVKCGFELNLVVGSSMSHMYMKCGSLKEGEKVIISMPSRNVVAWNTLIAGKAQNCYFEEVLYQYNLMRMAGFRPDKITLVSVISSCSELATLGQGQQIHAEVTKNGVSMVVSVITSLVSINVFFVQASVSITGNCSTRASSVYCLDSGLPSTWYNNNSVIMNGWQMRVFLLFPNDNNFDIYCGFFCNGTCNSYLFSVVAVASGGSHSLLWSANKDRPVKGNAMVELTGSGLLLRDSDGTQVWSSNPSSSSGNSIVGMSLNLSGNLILFNNESEIIWQSPAEKISLDPSPNSSAITPSSPFPVENIPSIGPAFPPSNIFPGENPPASPVPPRNGRKKLVGIVAGSLAGGIFIIGVATVLFIVKIRRSEVEEQEEDYNKLVLGMPDDPRKRPSMSTVVKMLEGVMEVDENIVYRFSQATFSAPVVHDPPSAPPQPSVLSNPR
ncbi:hypothetical protein QYF36_002698 [Acer negundo]|nr:hypothetical protein QYF36_002698 [Acer negundo]